MRRLGAITAVFGLLTIWNCGWSDEPTCEPATPAEIARTHVETALRFQLDGDPDYTQRLLQLALRADPDSAQARWHLKQAKVGDAWVSVLESNTDPQRQAVERQYRELRERALGDAKLESNLAKWSQRYGFEDRAHLHYRRVLANQTATDKLVALAMKKLDLSWVDGQLRTAAEVARIKARDHEITRALKKGRPQFVKWREAIENETRHAEIARTALQSLDDVQQIPVMESFLHDSGGKFGIELVQSLGRMTNSFAATKSLIQFAVLSPWGEVRRLAAEQLRERPLHDFVPMLIDGLTSPIVSRFSISRDGRGNVNYRHEIVRREADGDYASQLDHTSRHEHVTMQNGAVRSRNQVSDLGAEKTEIARLARSAQQREQALQEYNRKVESANQDVYEALEIATQTNVARSAPEWRDWWKKYYTETMAGTPVRRYYQPSSSTFYTVTVLPDSRREYESPQGPSNVISARMDPTQRGPQSFRSTPNISTSCFAAGTPVWTENGLVPIEEVKVGDRVLSQDPNSGELAYKVVLVPTVGAPTTRLQRIAVGEDAIRLTRSHVLWKEGVGWQMAKQLQPGDRLYGLKDDLGIDEAEPWPAPQEVYNLVVADFHTYFVGRVGILVHDITSRAPTSCLIPGLLLTNREAGVPVADSTAK